MKPFRRPTRAAIQLALAGLLIFLMLRWFEHSQVYHPDKTFDGNPAELGRPYEDVYFNAADGTKLNGWFFPAAINSPRRPLAVAYCHGNGGNISHRLDVCKTLLRSGVNVFLFDYRGYGRSEGWPGEEGTYLDAQAAHQWLLKKGFSGTNIIAFGESLGGGVASELALRAPLAGLVLQSTFSCVPDIGGELYPWLPVKWLCTIKYDTCKKLPRLTLPVLVMHSRDDRLIGFRHATRNFSVANEPKLFWELSGDHNDSVGDPDNFLRGFEQFLTLIENSQGGAKRRPTPL